MLAFSKPKIKDLFKVKKILSQWNNQSETEKYIARIRSAINGRTKFDMQFWVLKLDGEVVGLGGLSNCQPKLKPFLTKVKPKELKAIYLDKDNRGRGYGRELIKHLEIEARNQGYNQLLLVSAEKYRDTAYGFYEHLGFKKQGYVQGGRPGKKMAVFSKGL